MIGVICCERSWEPTCAPKLKCTWARPPANDEPPVAGAWAWAGRLARRAASIAIDTNHERKEVIHSSSEVTELGSSTAVADAAAMAGLSMPCPTRWDAPVFAILVAGGASHGPRASEKAGPD